MSDQLHNAELIYSNIEPHAIGGTVICVLIFLYLCKFSITKKPLGLYMAFCMFTSLVLVTALLYTILICIVVFWWGSIPIIAVTTSLLGSTYISKFFTRAKYRLKHRREIIERKCDEILSALSTLENEVTPKKLLFIKEGEFYQTNEAGLVGPMYKVTPSCEQAWLYESYDTIQFFTYDEGKIIPYDYNGNCVIMDSTQQKKYTICH